MILCNLPHYRDFSVESLKKFYMRNGITGTKAQEWEETYANTSIFRSVFVPEEHFIWKLHIDVVISKHLLF